MVTRRSGKVVNIASDAGRVGSSGEAVYSATKGAVIAFSKTLAREMARHGVTVNVVCPGLTETALLQALRDQSPKVEKILNAVTRATPLGRRTARPEEIASAVLFLASRDADFHHRPDPVGERWADDVLRRRHLERRKESLDQVEGLGLKPEAKRKLLRDNAVQLFKL